MESIECIQILCQVASETRCNTIPIWCHCSSPSIKYYVKYSVPCQKTHSEVSKYFSMEPLEEVIGVRRDKFLKMYCATDNYLFRLIDARN